MQAALGPRGEPAADVGDGGQEGDSHFPSASSKLTVGFFRVTNT